MPQGQQRTRARGHNLELYDVIYDGEISGDQLRGGLGLLTGVTTSPRRLLVISWRWFQCKECYIYILQME